MIFDKEFIWYKDHYAYHLTDKMNMENIINDGLIPKCGDRSKSVGDTRKAIYFFDSLYSIVDWIDKLYENKDIYKLELLRFNLKRRRWYSQNREIGDFYLPYAVPREKLEYLRIIDINGQYMFLNENLDNMKLQWEPLSNYKSLTIKMN